MEDVLHGAGEPLADAFADIQTAAEIVEPAAGEVLGGDGLRAQGTHQAQLPADMGTGGHLVGGLPDAWESAEPRGSGGRCGPDVPGTAGAGRAPRPRRVRTFRQRTHQEPAAARDERVPAARPQEHVAGEARHAHQQFAPPHSPPDGTAMASGRVIGLSSGKSPTR
ncbi:hypothetical protein [Actinacidiphila paucisporea]|uniref:hypothetical protein n=1 Tax=Actinacidiphila paucisporea TaxID=310782 RepID=UPI0011614A30|nr:hypothetical protein [Actinacidiphila paucisporea]